MTNTTRRGAYLKKNLLHFWCIRREDIVYAVLMQQKCSKILFSMSTPFDYFCHAKIPLIPNFYALFIKCTRITEDTVLYCTFATKMQQNLFFNAYVFVMPKYPKFSCFNNKMHKNYRGYSVFCT